MALFSIHFDGAITVDHKVSVRVLANTYEHMQRAIDRAYLMEVHGQVWKYARLKGEQYAATEFVAEYPREGGIILDAVRDGAEGIIDRIASAVLPVFEKAIEEGGQYGASLAEQYAQRVQYVSEMGNATQSFESLLADPPESWARAYSNRSIVKEIDPLVGVIRRSEENIADLSLVGSRVYPQLRFTPRIAAKFHAIAAERMLGPALIISARIRTLDRGNKRVMPSAKIENLATGREVTLHMHERADFDDLHPLHDGREIKIFASPVMEALGFDLYGGDLVYLDAVG
ncbi:hypothetical protein JY460_12105 [Stenotrophomonas maltophilia]|nr:hypothetical protein [Stenotrophomonas maltophilia]